MSAASKTPRPNRKRQPAGESGFNTLYSRYTYSAKKRGHEWALTKEEFRALTGLPCHYCEAVPEQTCDVGGGSAVSADTREHGRYTYNGIDRVDNSLGYSADNVVPCCKQCNFAKHKMSHTEFKEWLAFAGGLKTDEIPAVLDTMRKAGVRSFDFKGLKVEFEPTFKMPDMDDFEADPAFAKERLQSALDQVLQQKKEDDDVLFHSV